jgi:hypothetical protein
MKILSYNTSNFNLELNETSKGFTVDLFQKNDGVLVSMTSTLYPSLELATEEFDNLLTGVQSNKRGSLETSNASDEL